MNEPLTLKQLTEVIKSQAGSFDGVTTVKLSDEVSDGTRDAFASLREAYCCAIAFLAHDLRCAEAVAKSRTFRKALTEEDFNTLVGGGVVRYAFSDDDNTTIHHVELILSDIGYGKMQAIVMRGTAQTKQDGVINETR
jgi:hypothetical protein